MAVFTVNSRSYNAGVNAAGGNYRLQAGSPARDLARHPGTNATMHAGCYQTGLEEIGIES